MPRTRPFPLLIAAGGAAVLATPAHAAYAPRVAVAIDPAAAAAPVALTLTVTQEADEEATRSLRLTLPRFTAVPGASARPTCTAAAASAGTCPPESRTGAASSTTTFGTFSGSVHLAGGQGARTDLVAVLANPLVPVVLDQRLNGTLTAVTGGVELALDDLPGATATRLRVALDGGARALVAAPARCGTHEGSALLSSHGGEVAQRTVPVYAGGCPGRPPAILGARMVPARVRTGSVGTLSFSLAEPAAVRITARRSGTRRVRTLRRLTGRPGRVVVRRVARGLTPGRWLLTVRAADGDGATTRTLALRVLRR